MVSCQTETVSKVLRCMRTIRRGRRKHFQPASRSVCSPRCPTRRRKVRAQSGIGADKKRGTPTHAASPRPFVARSAVHCSRRSLLRIRHAHVVLTARTRGFRTVSSE